MKTNDFFEAMNDIDASLIERADRKTVKTRPVWKIAAIAAAITLIAAGMLVLFPMMRGDGNEPDDTDENIVGDAIVWSNVFELFNPNTGSGVIEEAKALVEKSFAEIETKKYAKYDLGNAFPLEKNDEFFGERLDEIKVRTGWYVYYNDTERDVVTVKAEVYEIKGVSTDAAVAVKYLEKGTAKTTEHFYAAVNTEYKCESLSGFFDDFNAAVHMEISKEALAREYAFGSYAGGIEKYRMNDGVPADICKLILGLDADAEPVGRYEGVDAKIHGCENMLRFTFAMNSAGRMINMLYVFDNGYIAIQGIGEGYTLFNVGVENTDAVFEMLKDGSELVTVIPTDPDGDGLVEVTTSAPVNEVAPE